MYTPHSLEFGRCNDDRYGYLLGIVANTFKGVKNYRFEPFLLGLCGWDFYLISVVLAFTMGSTSNDASSFLNNVRAAFRTLFIRYRRAVFNWQICGAMTWPGWRCPVSIGIRAGGGSHDPFICSSRRGMLGRL